MTGSTMHTCMHSFRSLVSAHVRAARGAHARSRTSARVCACALARVAVLLCDDDEAHHPLSHTSPKGPAHTACTPGSAAKHLRRGLRWCSKSPRVTAAQGQRRRWGWCRPHGSSRRVGRRWRALAAHRTRLALLRHARHARSAWRPRSGTARVPRPQSAQQAQPRRQSASSASCALGRASRAWVWA